MADDIRIFVSTKESHNLIMTAFLQRLEEYYLPLNVKNVTIFLSLLLCLSFFLYDINYIDSHFIVIRFVILGCSNYSVIYLVVNRGALNLV